MKSSTLHLTFLAGWPACGEASYGEWLATHRNFRHLDLASDSPAEAAQRSQWEQLCPATAEAFRDDLVSAHPRWVLTTPAPVASAEQLTALKKAGFSLWFLLARTEGLSRQQWLADQREANGDSRPLAWARRAEAIRKQARELRPLFRDRCIETLCGLGDRMSEPELCARIGVDGAL